MLSCKGSRTRTRHLLRRSNDLFYSPSCSAARPSRIGWTPLRSVDYSEDMGKVLMSEILSLSVAERIRLTQEIWESIAAIPDSIPLSQADREELDRRLAAYHADPAAGSPWSEVRERLLRRK
jgi:putative addiction module component (TIGR02574 family)